MIPARKEMITKEIKTELIFITSNLALYQRAVLLYTKKLKGSSSIESILICKIKGLIFII